MTDTENVELAVRGRFPGRPLLHVTHGLAKISRADDADAWHLVLPATGRLTHLTAAESYGWWTPHVAERLPVYIAVDAKASRVARSGVRGIRTDPFAEPRKVKGRLVDSPADVLLNAARDLSLLDLIVLVSAALHFGHCTRDEVRAVARRKRRGAPRLRQALEYADGRCESPYEVLLLVLHRIAGYAVEPQRKVYDASGALVARLDLGLIGFPVGHEYDGEHHGDLAQRDKDLDRERRLLAVGVTRRGYVARDVLSRSSSILRDCELTTGRPPTRGANARWLRMLAESTYTPPGQARLVRRCWSQSVTP